MSQNYPGGDPSYPGDPNSPSTNPQQPDHQPGYMRQPQQKRSGRSDVIVWCIAATLLILICVGAGVALYSGPQMAKDAIRSGAAAIGASSRVSQFCGDYRLQDYGDAYQHLSAAAQGRTSQTTFVSHQHTLDESAGAVTTCTIDSNHTMPSMSNDGNTATAQIQVARGSTATPTTGTLTLVYEDGAWKINSADSSLMLL